MAVQYHLKPIKQGFLVKINSCQTFRRINFFVQQITCIFIFPLEIICFILVLKMHFSSFIRAQLLLWFISLVFECNELQYNENEGGFQIITLTPERTQMNNNTHKHALPVAHNNGECFKKAIKQMCLKSQTESVQWTVKKGWFNLKK